MIVVTQGHLLHVWTQCGSTLVRMIYYRWNRNGIFGMAGCYKHGMYGHSQQE